MRFKIKLNFLEALRVLKIQPLSAAFLCAVVVFIYGPLSTKVHASFATVKQNTMELLLQKKKKQALQELVSYIRTELNQNNKNEANLLLVKVAQKFIFREAQEAYENSINLTLDNLKEATKSSEICLNIEPQQLDCLIQKARLLLRAKNYKLASETIATIKEIIPNSKYENWLETVLIKNKIEFKNKSMLKTLPKKKSEDDLGLVLLELDRCFMAKNYLCIKDLVVFFEENYSDWPDLIFYKHKLSQALTEEKAKEKFSSSSAEASAEELVRYKNKCKGLSKTTARKYRYDFDLCVREI